MQTYIGVGVLCLVPGFLSCFFHELFSKDRPKIDLKKTYVNHIIKTTVFYTIIFYTVLSLFKVILGRPGLTLIASFNEVSWKTYLHYAIPLIIISIAFPFILNKLLREKTDDFVLMALSLIVLIGSIVYLLFDRINNVGCVCIVAAGTIFSLLIAYFYKGKVSYCTPKTLKKRLRLIVPIVLFWVILMVLYLPNELYLGNVSDIDIPYSIFVSTLLIGALLYFVVYTVISVYFLTSKQFRLLNGVIFSISILCFIQEMLLNGKMDVMDGSRQTWPLLTVIVNTLIWCAVMGILICLQFIIKKKNITKIYSTICIYLSLIQLVTWGYLVFNTDLDKAESNVELTTEARLELDAEHNVIIFVLDWYDGQILDRVIAENEDFLKPLEDFTWYKNMTSSYAFTAMSVPYLLTDVPWQYDMTEIEYRDYAFANGTLLYDIADKNYDIGLYTSKKYVPEEMKNILRNYSDVTSEGWNYYEIINQMLGCSKYKSYPFALKSKYWYADGDIARAVRDTTVHSIVDDAPFYLDLTENGIQVRSSDRYDGAFRFYHLHGMHTPFKPDMVSQGKYCLNIVYEYLTQLKNLGLYDEATIIITADHGHNYLSLDKRDKLELYNFEMATSPILFVKKSGQTNEEGPEISMAPVSHSEMPASIIEAVCGDTLGYGDTFDDIEEDAQRERYFIYRRYDDVPYAKYAINGYARDWNNWSLLEAD